MARVVGLHGNAEGALVLLLAIAVGPSCRCPRIAPVAEGPAGTVPRGLAADDRPLPGPFGLARVTGERIGGPRDRAILEALLASARDYADALRGPPWDADRERELGALVSVVHVATPPARSTSP